MANPFTKAWKYLMALFSSKVDEYADPKVQIQQAIEDAQRQHAALSQQAAAVIGNQRQLEMKLTRQMGDVERLSSSARQALVLADEQRAKGNAAEADTCSCILACSSWESSLVRSASLDCSCMALFSTAFFACCAAWRA